MHDLDKMLDDAIEIKIVKDRSKAANAKKVSQENERALAIAQAEYEKAKAHYTICLSTINDAAIAINERTKKTGISCDMTDFTDESDQSLVKRMFFHTQNQNPPFMSYILRTDSRIIIQIEGKPAAEFAWNNFTKLVINREIASHFAKLLNSTTSTIT